MPIPQIQVITPKLQKAQRAKLLKSKASPKRSRFSTLADGAMSYAQSVLSFSRYLDASTEQPAYPQTRE